MNNDVTSVVDKTVKHVRISKYVQTKFIDDEAPVSELPAVDSNIFSIDITNESDVFPDNQLLLTPVLVNLYLKLPHCSMT